MKIKSKNKFFVILAIVLAFFVIGNFCLASATMEGLNTAAGKGYNNDPNNLDGLTTITLTEKIGQIIGVVLSLIGVMFLVLMIYAGFTWMFARGNEQDVEKAKRMIEAAIAGLIIVLSAYAITNYVSTNLL